MFNLEQNNLISLDKNPDDYNKINDSIYDYSKFTNLEDFKLDCDLVNKFSPLAEKLKLNQEAIELLLELALEMSRRQKSQTDKDEDEKLKEKIDKYSKLMQDDSDIPTSNPLQTREYMKIASKAYNELCSDELKEIFKNLGLIYHPELIKMFHKIGELSQEDTFKDFGKPAFEELTPAQILYGGNK